MQLETLRQEWKADGDWKKTQEFWDLRAAEFAEKERDSSRMRSTLAYLEGKGVLGAGTAVLDVGCGPGAYALAFARRGASVVGTDISGNMLRHARNRAEEEGLLGKPTLYRPFGKRLIWKRKAGKALFDLTLLRCVRGSALNVMRRWRCAALVAKRVLTFARRRDVVREQLGRLIFRRFLPSALGKRFPIPWRRCLPPVIT